MTMKKGEAVQQLELLPTEHLVNSTFERYVETALDYVNKEIRHLEERLIMAKNYRENLIESRKKYVG